MVEGQEAGEYFVVGQVGGPAVGGGDGSIEGVVEIVEQGAGGAARVVEIGERAGLQNGGGFFIPGLDAVGKPATISGTISTSPASGRGR